MGVNISNQNLNVLAVKICENMTVVSEHLISVLSYRHRTLVRGNLRASSISTNWNAVSEPFFESYAGLNMACFISEFSAARICGLSLDKRIIHSSRSIAMKRTDRRAIGRECQWSDSKKE